MHSKGSRRALERDGMSEADTARDGGRGARVGAVARATAADDGAPVERMRYASGGVRQTLIGLALLLLLPFTLGALFMLARRAMDGLMFDAAGIAIIAVGLIAVAVMLSFELLHAARARLTFGKTALRFTLPRGGGPTPMLRYQSADIPYHAIKSVELRREVFGGKVAPVLLRALVLRTKDAREFVLGHTLEGFDDPAFPFAEIAQRIATRCALPVNDQRTIWRRTRAERRAGYISEFDTESYILDPTEVDKLNLAHRRLIVGIASAFVALLLLGLLADLSA